MGINFSLEYNSRTPEVKKSYIRRVRSGFYQKYCGGDVVLDIGYKGGAEDALPAIPHAIGVDRDYPGYDGATLPFESNSVDTVFSSHCLEHVTHIDSVIRDWYRVLKVGGFIVCIVPHQWLYEKRMQTPSRFNGEHLRFYTPASLVSEFERVLPINGHRIRHLADNDADFDYSIPPDQHSAGCYEIELVIEKIAQPEWAAVL